MVRLLLQHGADVNYCCDLHGTALNIALKFGKDESLTSLFLDHGARSDPEVAFRQEAFEKAVGNGYRRALDHLFDEVKDCGIEEMKLLLGPALNAAVRSRNDELIKLLTDRGADVKMVRSQPKWTNGAVRRDRYRGDSPGHPTDGRVIARQQDASRPHVTVDHREEPIVESCDRDTALSPIAGG